MCDPVPFNEWTGFEHVPHTRKQYMVTESVRWDVGKLGSGLRVTVPLDFIFDVSTPRLLERFANPHDKDLLAAASIHDYLFVYKNHDATFAAGEFRRCLRARGYSAQRSWLLFFGVFFYSAFVRQE